MNLKTMFQSNNHNKLIPTLLTAIYRASYIFKSRRGIKTSGLLGTNSRHIIAQINLDAVKHKFSIRTLLLFCHTIEDSLTHQSTFKKYVLQTFFSPMHSYQRINIPLSDAEIMKVATQNQLVKCKQAYISN